MTDRAISKEAMLTSLRDIHLPAEAPGGFVADLAVAVGLACLAALVIAALLRALSLKARPNSARTLQDRLAALADRSEAERRVALLHLLREHQPDRYAELRGALYRPGNGLDLALLEAEVARRV
ncbi:hypothetical protein [Roseobacter weihaiensis]|uniref:hypothetical protein n=1 Tax=Roseobacter weihaiensis TaxID=2763262 RepID=UPI001D0A5875|nr:hypothetical protein [Roseobacter sp. H9]